MANTRFSGQILRADGLYYNMPQAYALDYCSVWDDFVMVNDDQTNDWQVVKDTGASAGIVADTANGEYALTSTATTDNDGASIQGNEIFRPSAERSMWFETRLQNNLVDQSDICVGFTSSFATNPEAMLAATDRICFQIDDGDASILCKTESGGTETSTDSGVDLVNNTWAKLSIQVVGTGKVKFYVDRTLVAQHTANIPTATLALGAMSLSGNSSGTRVTTLDYIFGAQTR